MQKQESNHLSYDETWSFNDNGKKFTVQKRNNLFTFKVHDQLTMEWFQSQSAQLSKINQKTIEAAFDPKVNAVTYQFLQKSQKEAILQFIIKLEYVLTQFRQEILLKKLEINKQTVMKMQYEDLYQEIKSVQKMIDTQKEAYEIQILIQKGYFDSDNGFAYQLELKKGKYLLSLTGYYMSYVVYNGDYQYDQCQDQFGNIIQSQYGPQHNVPLKMQISFENKQAMSFISPKPNFLAGYQYHFSFSTTLNLQKQEKIKINFFLEEGSRLIMNHSMLTIFPYAEPY